MSKVYPSNLTQAQFELLNDLIPKQNPVAVRMKLICGRLSMPFSRVLVEGVRWRALPGDFPAWQTVYT